MDPTFLIVGATGRTGRHFVSLALEKGHTVRALVRNPGNLSIQNPKLELHKGSISDDLVLDELLQGGGCVVCMLGDAVLQRENRINTHLLKRLIPAMQRRG